MAWPRAMPGIGHELTPPQALACALRILAHEGWQENLSGHITWADEAGEALWVNPWGMWWSEVRARDIVRVAFDGTVFDGTVFDGTVFDGTVFDGTAHGTADGSAAWDVTPAVFLHTELHRARPDARIVVHNHPYAATVLASLGIEPVISHQNACIFDGDLAFVDEYDGTVESAAAGRWLAEHVGPATGVLLANHGAIVTGESIGAACYRAVTFERMCRFTLDALQAGRELRPLPESGRAALKAELIRNTPDAYWNPAVRQLLAREPDVLD